MGCSFGSRVSILIAVFCLSAAALAQDPKPRTVEEFNQTFTQAIRSMDNAAVLRLWAEDGVSLLPGKEPITGINAIRQFMDDVTAKTQGFKVVSHENKFHDVEISADWASEWAETEQVVQPPAPKPTFTIHGKMLLVLHREKPGTWKIKEEAWTNSPGN